MVQIIPNDHYIRVSQYTKEIFEIEASLVCLLGISKSVLLAYFIAIMRKYQVSLETRQGERA